MRDLSYQLYSSRNHLPLDGTCAMLAEAGYREVEGYGVGYDDPAATSATLAQHGLRMTSGHFPLDRLEADAAGCIAVAQGLGMDAIYCPFLMPDARPGDADGWRRLASERLVPVLRKVADAGLAFGWHNHDFELKPLPDGSVPLDLILDSDPDMKWEADLAWVVVGGGDVDACIKRHAARITAVHVKDIAPAGECADEDGWADVGHGTMDWCALLAALADCPLGQVVLEHDKPADDQRFATRSIATLRGCPALAA